MANTLTFANQTISDANIFGGVNYIADLNSGTELTIGNTASASVSFVTDVQVPKYSKDTTNGKFTWAQDSTVRGRFFVADVTKEQGKYTVEAYDAIYLLETNVSALSLTFPLSVSAAAAAIAAFIGCTISGTIYNGTMVINEGEFDTLMTVRQLLSYVAEASGASVMIDESDHLCFMYYASSGITVTADQYKRLEVADYTCAAIDNVTIFNSEGEIQVAAGTGTNSLYIQGNPFLFEASDTQAATILAQVSGLVYAPVTCEMFTENGLKIGTTATFGSTSSLVMHIESSEAGAKASSVGSDIRAEYNQSITQSLNVTKAIAIDAQTLAGAAQTAAAAAQTAADTAQGAAQAASDAATQALADASTAQGMAESASRSAQDARVDAGVASASANTALSQLGVVEDIVGVLDFISKDGTYQRTQDPAPITDKWYFARSGSGTDADPYVYTLVTSFDYTYFLTEDTAVDPDKTYYTRSGTAPNYTYTEVSNPVDADLGTYYEHTNSPHLYGYYEITGVEDAIKNYISSRLVVTGQGLWIQDPRMQTRILLSPTDGVQLYGVDGFPVASYGEKAVIGRSDGFHIEIDGDEIGFYQTEDLKVAYVRNNQLFIPQSTVLSQMDLGLPVGEVNPSTGEVGYGQWSWKLHLNGESPQRHNLYLKWMG